VNVVSRSVVSSSSRVSGHWVRFALVLVVSLIGLELRAASPVDIYEFDSAEQQARYRGLIDELRCPKCMNTNLAGSDAPIAQDLRRTVHRLVVQEGYDDQAVRDYLQARYGDFVLYRPPFSAQTWLLWMVPVGLGVIGVGVLIVLRLRSSAQETEELSQAETQRIAALLRSTSKRPDHGELS